MSKMNPTHHCGCIGRRCRYEMMGKLCGVSLGSHLEQIHTFLQERLAEILNDCLRFDHNQSLFFLKTLLPNPWLRYRIRELHPQDKPYHFAGRCCLCEWEPMGMTMDGSEDYLRGIGPYNEPPTPDTEDDTYHHHPRRIPRMMSLLGRMSLGAMRMTWLSLIHI